MVALLCTMGHSSRFVLPLVDTVGTVSKVILIHPADDKAMRARGQVERQCRRRELPLEAVAIADVGDPVTVARAVRTLLRQLRADASAATAAALMAPVEGGEGAAAAAAPLTPPPVLVHLTHGIGALSGGALLACMLEGVPASYGQEQGLGLLRLPVLALPYGDLLTPRQLEVLRAVHRLGGAVRLKELRKALRKDQATMTHHLRELERLGAVELVEVPTDRREKIVRLQPNLELLLPQLLAAKAPPPAAGGSGS